MSRYEQISAANAQRITQLVQTPCGFISRLIWSPDGKQLALAHGDGLWLWDDAFGGEPTRKLIGHSAPVKDVAFSSDGQVLASASSDMTVRLWMTMSGQPLHILRRHSNGVNSVAFSANGRLLASGGADQTVFIFDMMDSTGSTALAGHTNEITSVVFGGNLLATGGWDNSVRLWDATEKREISVIPFEDWVRDLSVSADAQYLAAACKDGTVRLIEFASGEVVHIIQAHEHGVDCAAFSPDGSLLVTGGRDHLVKLWDLRAFSDQPVMQFEGHSKPVLTVAFHPTGNMFASGSGDHTARLWAISE
jgi:WD40 repeat protein